MYNLPRDEYIDGTQLEEETKLTAGEINDAVNMLESNGYVEKINWLGTYPFDFGQVCITSSGRFEFERAKKEAEERSLSKNTSSESIEVSRHLNPVGSPYGFNDNDWELLSLNKSKTNTLFVVFGYQFNGEYYNSENLVQNIYNHFINAVESYNRLTSNADNNITLEFKALSAGYGEHLFNEIARDIISADIAVFDTSTMNPNVMIELGVALTWGIRVLPIQEETCNIPPSDISGQTWIKYRNNGMEMLDKDFIEKLKRMIERAIKKKNKKFT